ncbi:MAG TPA: rhodanese-like domain-containing protein [Polyangiales bacterium]
MTHARISAQEAAQLMAAEGYVYLDVRAPEEFGLGHPQGAYNVPLMLLGSSGMQPNAEFLRVVQASFGVEAKLVVGCQAGNRSQRACVQLLAAGYVSVVEQRAGFAGARDAFGRVVEVGWQGAGLPTQTQAVAGRSYEALRVLDNRDRG